MAVPSIHKNSVASRWSQIACASLGLYAFAGGLISFLGWAADVPRLASWGQNGVTIQPNTTIAAMAAGAALILLVFGFRRAAAALGAFVTLIGSSVLFQYLSGVDLGIDTLFMFGRNWGRVGVTSPGRMGPAGATSWSIIGLAFVFASLNGRARSISPALGLVTTGIASLSFVGYLYGASVLYLIPTVTIIALQTSTFILAVSLGLVMSNPEAGPMRLLASDSVAGVLVRRIAPFLILFPIMVGYIRLKGEQAGLYDTAFGSAIRTLTEIGLFMLLLWWTASTIRRQAERRQQTEAKLFRKEKQLQHITDNAAVLVSQCSRDLRYVFVNKTCADFLGRPIEEIVGKPIGEVLGTAALERIQPFIDRVLAGERVEYEAEIPYLGAGIRYVRVVYVPDHDSSGAVCGWIAAVTDLTERRAAEKAVAQAREAAERANTLKDEFLATLSHELRNPLNVILGYSEILLRTPQIVESQQLRGLSEALRRNAQSQSQLINDLLDLSRLQMGKVSLNKETVSLAGIVTSSIETVRIDANAKQITIDVNIPNDLLFIEGDSLRLQQIVWNILNNAVKFTPSQGTITVSLSVEGEEAVLSVADNGLGISPEFLPHVFEMFRQADPSSVRRQGGLGIGLALVQQLVGLHGGSVTADSKGLGHGACFTIRLPGCVVKETPFVPQSDVQMLSLSNIGVLVVDDSEDTVVMLQQLLEMNGAKVHTARSGSEALQAANQHQFDVILSDVSMPEMDGFEFLRKLRELPAHHDVPVLALTGFGRPEDIERAKQAGFFSHITKPFDLDKLAITLRSIPRKQRDGDGSPH